jgi:hypothetical protein
MTPHLFYNGKLILTIHDPTRATYGHTHEIHVPTHKKCGPTHEIYAHRQVSI